MDPTAAFRTPGRVAGFARRPIAQSDDSQRHHLRRDVQKLLQSWQVVDSLKSGRQLPVSRSRVDALERWMGLSGAKA